MFEFAEGGLVLIRFAPFSAAKLLEQAEDHYFTAEFEGRPLRYAVSMFGRVLGADEHVDTLVQEVATEAGLRNGGKVAVVPADVLMGDGFSVHLTEPPPNHYDVELGPSLDEGQADRLSQLFQRERRPNPCN